MPADPSLDPARTRLRPAIEADADRIAELHVVGWQDYRALLPAAFVDDPGRRAGALARWRSQLRHYTDEAGGVRVWVAELDGRVAGFTSFGPCLDPGLTSANELIDLWVDPERRGLGLGSRLVELVLSELPRPVVVWVLRGNERAAALYRRFGAQHTAVQRTETISEFGGFDIVDQLLVVHS